MEKSIFDTGFLYVYFDKTDAYHEACNKIFLGESLSALLPDVVLPELAHLVSRRLNVKKLTDFLRSIAEILEKYDDNNIDLVDAVIVAMAEQLEITKILTVDRRHFAVFQPKHCESFTLLPE